MDLGASETVGSPEALQSVLSAVPEVMPRAKVDIDVEAGRSMTFKLAGGTTTCAYPLVWMQNTSRMVQYLRRRINWCANVVEYQRTQGTPSNARLRHEHDSIQMRQVLE